MDGGLTVVLQPAALKGHLHGKGKTDMFTCAFFSVICFVDLVIKQNEPTVQRHTHTHKESGNWGLSLGSGVWGLRKDLGSGVWSLGSGIWVRI